MAACHAHRFDKAHELFEKVDVAKKDYLAQICMKDGYDPRTLPP